MRTCNLLKYKCLESQKRHNAAHKLTNSSTAASSSNKSGWVSAGASVHHVNDVISAIIRPAMMRHVVAITEGRKSESIVRKYERSLHHSYNLSVIKFLIFY